MMDNQQRPWSRFFSKLKWSHRRAGYSCAQRNSHTPGQKLWQLARCRSAPTTTLAAPSLEVNAIHGSGPSRSSENGIHFRFGGRLAERQEGFIPKCLSDLNTQTLLNGQGGVENFSRNCWLENNLHRFGQLPTAFNSITEIEFQVVTTTDGDLNVPIPVRQERLATFQRVLRNNQLMNSLLGESHLDQRSTSSLSASTISSNSNVPNLNLSILGFAFDPDASAVDPPPYSEFPDDPPPSYEESTLVEYRTRASGIQTNFLSNVDYLY